MRISKAHTIIGLIFSIFINKQEISGDYIFINKENKEQTIITRLRLSIDSTFKYSCKGDLYSDQAEGKYSIVNNTINLEYQTYEESINTEIIEKQINTDSPAIIKTNEVKTWSNPTVLLRPIKLLIKKNKLIVISTVENPNNKRKNRKFIFKKYKQ